MASGLSAVARRLYSDQPRVHVAAVGVGQQRRGVQVDLGGGRQRRSAGRARGRPSASARPRPACRCRAGSRPPSCCRSGSRPAPRRRRGSPGRASPGRSPLPSSSICWIASSRCAACLVRPSHVGHQQVGVGLVVAAADAPAQLVQLRQAELVGAADDDGVGGGHVDAGLDDGRAQQQVVALRDEVAHHVLQLALGHLAVGDGDARLGQQLLPASGAGSGSSRPRCAGSRPGRRASARAARPRG